MVRYHRGNDLVTLLGVILASPFVLMAASTSPRDVFTFQDHLLRSAAPSVAESTVTAGASLDSQDAIPTALAGLGGSLDSKDSNSLLTFTTAATGLDGDGDTIHPDPRPRMKK